MIVTTISVYGKWYNNRFILTLSNFIAQYIKESQYNEQENDIW